METNLINNPEVISQTPLISPPPQKNIFKILFFICLGLFLIVLSVLAYSFINSKKINNQSQKQVIQNINQTVSPTITEEKSNVLKISDIQMDLPSSWEVVSVSGNTAKILTDYDKYQVYLTLELNKNNSSAESSYKSAGVKTKTQYGEIFNVQGGGPLGWTGALINNSKYSFIWGIESNQLVPTNLDGVWKPDNNITSEILLNITKTVRPLTETSNSTQDWKTYNDKTASLTFKYPNDIPIFSFPSIDYTNKSESYITTEIYELSSLDNTESETSYKNSIEKGQLPKDAPIGAKIIKLNNGKYAMIYMTLTAFEECDVRLSRGISFYTSKHKVFISYQYNHNRSVIPSKYLTTNNVCEQEKVWKDRNIVISDFDNKTFSDKTIQDWYNTFDQIIKTINF